jgi:putative ABC transport system permease protein
MGFAKLAWRSLLGNAFRSAAIFICAALIAGLALTATFVVRGAEASLRSNLERMGADLLVLPWGTITEKIEGVRLMSAAIDGWIPAATMDKLMALEEIEAVSPQLYLGTFEDSPYSPYPDMYLVAYDPASDFTLMPWLESRRAQLSLGEAVAGAQVALPGGGNGITLHGVPLEVVDRLVKTDTTIDRTLFVSFETAEAMELWSVAHENSSLKLVPGAVSAIMVKVRLESDPHQAAIRVLEEVKGVTPLENPRMFQAERRQMAGILRMLLGVLGGIWILALVFMGLMFTIAANERRYEIGVLRALGFPGRIILKTLLIEGAILALSGGFTGIVLALAGVALAGERLTLLTRLPLYVPNISGMLLLFLAAQALTLLSVSAAAFLPAWRISREEVALSMRA